jgi:ankyrin repeat protein
MKIIHGVVLTVVLLALAGCGGGPPRCTASQEQQKQFGSLAAMSGLDEMRTMLAQDVSLVHSRINGANDERPIHWAALSGNLDVVTLLLDNGAMIDAVDAQGLTALHWAAWQGRPEVARLLVDQGAAVDVISAAGNTALDRAISDGHQDVAEYLTSIGARRGSELTE